MNELHEESSQVDTEEFSSRNYRIWYDFNLDALRIKNYYPLTKDDVTRLLPLVNKILEDKKQRCFLVDLTGLPIEKMVDKDSRQVIRNYKDNKEFDKIAVFGASPVIRMIAKVMISVAGSSGSTKFFKSEDEAVDWIREK